jgi:prepilin-type N-terminal cleavage/methylation domain-containing protein/prepilin-type processing-associated H-X9-DG protein
LRLTAAESLYWQSGFTLLELLAVIAIAAVLAALSRPPSIRRRPRASDKLFEQPASIAASMDFYAEDNDDALPESFGAIGKPETLWLEEHTDSWVGKSQRRHLHGEYREWESLSLREFDQLLIAVPGRYQGGCQRSMRRTRSYSMSAYLNGDETEVDPRVKVKLAEVQMQPASKIFVFIEEDATSPWLGSFKLMPVDGTSLAAAASFASVPGAWHNGGSDLSFADGHVEYWRWYAARKPARSVSPASVREQVQNLRRLHEAIPKP